MISGYLITGMILTEKADKTFSISRFYERRIRRIFPALFFVVAATLVGGWLWFMPLLFEDLTKSVIAVSFFVSNFFFRWDVAYFGPVAEEKPLLHTWSLAVEEQFYILFPIFLVLLWPLGRHFLTAAIILGAFLSLALSEYGWRYHPAANFYFLPTRVWELLVGAMVAFAHHAGISARRCIKEAAAAAGLALIMYAVFCFDKSTPTPSLFTLIPTVGAALILLTNDNGTTVGRILSVRLIVGIGLISYSAYLWHQPLFVFARIRSLEHPSTWTFAGLVLLSLALAYLTWRFIEQPVRNRQFFSRWQIFTGAACFTAMLVATATVSGIYFKDAEIRLGAVAYRYSVLFRSLREERWRLIREGACHYGEQYTKDIGPFLGRWDCIGENGFRDVIVVGDSTAADKAMGLRENGIGVGQLTVASCEMAPSLMTADCRRAFHLIRDLRDRGELRGLILVKRMLNEYGELSDEKIEELISYWSGFGVPLLILSSTPEFEAFDARVVKFALLNRPLSFEGFENFEIARRSYRALERHNNGRAYLINSEEVYCRVMGEGCRPIRDGEMQLVDGVHLRRTAAQAFMAAVMRTRQWASFTAAIGYRPSGSTRARSSTAPP